jgi:hypothetical protein
MLPQGVYHLSARTYTNLQEAVELAFPGTALPSRNVNPAQAVWLQEIDVRESNDRLQGFVHGYMAGLIAGRKGL